MKLPRDVSGEELVRYLGNFGYEITRQTGSHIRVTSKFKGKEHHITVPAHKQLKVGTLAEVLSDVASYLELTREELVRQLFG
ncbi:MAG TPA: type II toxin-antitoxin system HicA family toxin [Candidatus Acidoferrum sp.]|nr:type II toxin-antitoxin system HicA family toxin [Candidatus Acidoferrum sp.]